MSGNYDVVEQCETVVRQLGWTPFDFQRQCWTLQASGESGLLTVPTGSGKTIAAVLPTICETRELHAESKNGRSRPRLRLLYITPLRALARDIERQIRTLSTAAEADLAVECRTGDTSASRKRKQLDRMPEVLITTPESFALILSREQSRRQLSGVRTLILDEWHELFGGKRGTLCELSAAALRQLSPTARTWALSATIGNMSEAADAATGEAEGKPNIIRSEIRRAININLINPPQIDSFPWAGHLGRSMVEPLLETLDIDTSTIVFCNTRNQAEQWYQEIIGARPQWLGYVALHHGSIDRKIREEIEARMLDGRLKWVIATSSLDLGIDFHPVERVVQIGSAKGVSRLMQRAGRSGHSPAGESRLYFVPTNALEILELSALREAVTERDVEPRRPPRRPLDVLVQHLVTRACGYGFETEAMYEEIRSAWSYRSLSRAAFDWALGFIEHGGALNKYPQYRKVVRDRESGMFEVRDRAITRLHRMGIGTIGGDGVVALRSGNNLPLGTVEERFIGKLRKGDTFNFAGRTFELVRVKDGVAHVRKAGAKATATPSWAGGRLPFSGNLGEAIREILGRYAKADEGDRSASPTRRRDRGEAPADTASASTETNYLSFLLETQRRVSVIPDASEVLAEIVSDRAGTHMLLFPFEGHGIHEALGAVYAYRFSQRQAGTFTVSLNDYGVGLFAPKRYPFAELAEEILGVEVDEALLLNELREAMNLAELARSRFRDIARIAGLVIPGFPGKPKSTRQIQVSSSLLFDVFSEYDPENPLLQQAFDEAIYETAEFDKLFAAAKRISTSRIRIVHPERPSPIAFPLYVERMRARLSSEKLSSRIARLKERYAKT